MSFISGDAQTSSETLNWFIAFSKKNVTCFLVKVFPSISLITVQWITECAACHVNLVYKLTLYVFSRVYVITGVRELSYLVMMFCYEKY